MARNLPDGEPSKDNIKLRHAALSWLPAWYRIIGLGIHQALFTCQSLQTHHTVTMRSTKSSITLALAVLASSVLASPVAAPAPTAAPNQEEVARAIEKRAATCSFSGSSGYSLASESKASCSTIILDSLTVPGGTTLDMTDLPDETVVIFQGTTTFGHKEWDGPLFAVSGTNVKVAGHASGSSVLDGQGALYWDGKGSNSGVTKPKFFQAHDLTHSLIENLKILNPPVQVFSINGAQNLEIAYVTIDASAGDTDDLGHNTDGFDIGSSDSVTIKNATVYNQVCDALFRGFGPCSILASLVVVTDSRTLRMTVWLSTPAP